MHWKDVEPILRAAYDSLQSPPPNRGLGHLVQITGSEQINEELERDPDDPSLDVPLKLLRDAGYFETAYRAGGGRWTNITLSEKALQRVAGWPSQNGDTYDQLLALLEQREAEAQTPAEKSRAEKLRLAVAGAGRDLVIDVIGNIATKGI